MGRVAGVEPGGGPARELAPGCVGTDLTLSGAAAVGGALAVTGNAAIGGTASITGALSLAAKLLLSNAGLGLTSDPTYQLLRSGNEWVFQRAGDTVWSTTTSGMKVERELRQDANASFTALFKNSIVLEGVAVKTANYEQAAVQGGSIIVMNGAGLTLTLAATPINNQLVFVKNLDAGNLTIARNGKTIDGAAADLTVAGGGQVLLHFHTAVNGWIRLA